MKRLLAIIAALIVSASAIGQQPDQHCLPLGSLPQATRQYAQYWSDRGASEYGMNVKEARVFRAELTARAMQSLMSRADFAFPTQGQRRAIARHAIATADDTLVEMGILFEEEVKPEKAAK